ncbi:helix-turn-helix transcriptional regulator [Terasakiella pusilla]
MYRLMQRGDFPRPVQMGPRAVGWYRHEVDEWLIIFPCLLTVRKRKAA